MFAVARKLCGLAILSTLLASSAAQADALTLSAAGGEIVDATDSESGTSLFTFIDDDMPRLVSSIESITLTGFTHPYTSDLYVALVWMPDDINADPIAATLFDGINDGEFFLTTAAVGDYSFTDEATSTFQEAAQNGLLVMPGTFRPAEFYLEGETPEHPNLDALFGGLDLSAGTFMLYLEDAAAPDSGMLTSATLNLTTSLVPEPTSLAAVGVAGLFVRRRR